MSFLKIKDLSVDYKMRKETVYAAKNVNIEVNLSLSLYIFSPPSMSDTLIYFSTLLL